jgi:transcriptional regulator with XRE-family HTH domain
MNAPKLLIAWRQSLGLSQADAAKLLGLGPGALSEYERAKKVPRIKHAMHIQRVTGGAVPIDAWDEVPADIESGPLPLAETPPITGTDD